jgi:hypothetical protein
MPESGPELIQAFMLRRYGTFARKSTISNHLVIRSKDEGHEGKAKKIFAAGQNFHK